MPVTNYIWHGENILMEKDDTGQTTADYSYDPGNYGELISQRRWDGANWQTRVHHYDALGSTRALTDETGAETDSYTYDAWGNEVAPTSTFGNPFRWVGNVGYYWDEELDSYYVRARSYQPLIAMWLSVDPFKFIDAVNALAYVNNRPVESVDPSGMVVGGSHSLLASLLCALPDEHCTCADEPAKCKLEYTGKAVTRPFFGLANGGKGYGQAFAYTFTVSLIHADGKSTCGCHILQSVVATYAYSDKADAKPHKPTDHGKPEGKMSFSSAVEGNVVTVKDSHDYTSVDTRCLGHTASIEDTPGFRRGPTKDMRDRLDAYTFNAENEVQEVPAIKGTVKMSVSFDWKAPRIIWSVKSSDGRISDGKNLIGKKK